MNQISTFFDEFQIKSTFVILKKINENGKYLNFFGKGYSLSFDLERNDKYEKIKYFFNNLIDNNNLKVNLSKDSLINSTILKKNVQYKKFTNN